MSVHSRYQYMLDWHDIYNDMLDSSGFILTGIQVGFDTHPSDSSWWANAYNYPSLSLGFSYDNVGSMKTKPGTSIGDFYNLYLASEFDFFRAGIFSVGPVPELGMSYTTDKYNPRRNVVNQFIGSKVVANLAAGAKLKYYMAAQETDKKISLEKPEYPKGLRWNIYTAFLGFGMRAHYFDRSYCIEYSAGITF